MLYEVILGMGVRMFTGRVAGNVAAKALGLCVLMI